MREKNRTNVIPFPNLKDRLLEKGMDALKGKNYQEALIMFSDAKKFDQDQAEIHLGIALCLMELGELEDAKKVCKKMLLEDIGHYFTVLQVYLTILIQLRQYEEVQTTIEAVLEENHLPAESAEHFYKLLEFSRKMNNSEEFEVEEEEDAEEKQVTYLEDLLENVTQQIGFIESLKDRNIVKHLSILRKILENPQGHPVIKSMILQLMKEHEIEKEMTVHKFGEAVTIKPAELEDLSEMPFTKKVLNILDDTLGNENPTLFEAVKELWIRHLFVLFPFLPEPSEATLWAAALHLVGYEMHGISIDIEEVIQTYNVELGTLHDAAKRIYQIEEISYLQI